jgi:hypothetical protein
VAAPFSPALMVADLATAIERVVRRVSGEVVLELSTATPIDTHLAASSWIAAVGQRPEGLEALEDATGPRASREALVPLADSLQSAGLEALTSFRLEHGSVHIVNPVPYIGDLDEGSSPQAAPGFTAAAIERAVENAVAHSSTDLGR